MRLIFALLITFAFASSSSAQCPGGVCQLQQAPKAAVKVAVKATEKAVTVAAKPVKEVAAVHQTRRAVRKARRGC